jgi:hypothetical protein
VSPARELEHTATYRLGVDIEGAGGKVPGRSLLGKCPFGSLRNAVSGNQRRQVVFMSLVCSTVLGTHLEIKVNNCTFVSLWGQVGVSSKPPVREDSLDLTWLPLVLTVTG